MSIQSMFPFPARRGSMTVPRKGYALIPRRPHRLRVFPVGEGRHAGTMAAALILFKARRVVDYPCVWAFLPLSRVIFNIEVEEWISEQF